MTANEAKFDYDYMVKYKNMSYQHVQWLSANDIGMYIRLLLLLYTYVTIYNEYTRTSIHLYMCCICIDAMSNKSKQTLLRYLNKLDKGDPTAPEETEIDPRCLHIHSAHTFTIYILYIIVMLLYQLDVYTY